MRYHRARPWVLALAAFGALLIGPEYLGDHSAGSRADVWLWSALTAAPLLLLIPRYTIAGWVLALVLGALQPSVLPVDETLPWPPLLSCIAALVLFTVGLRHSRRVLVAVWVTTSIAGVIAIETHGGPGGTSVINGTTVLIAALLLVGHLIGGRRRVERVLAVSEEQRAVLEERARIARELHDVVAHHMSVIAVQAETAAYRIPDLPQAGKVCLAEIASTARESLTQMRRLLGVLRSDSDEMQLNPQPTLGEIDDLVAGARRAGLTVMSTVEGEPTDVPPAAGVSAYRIVQEALSNVVRHAPSATAEVRISFEPRNLRVTVANGAPPGPAPPPADGQGHGLLGMRERATMLSGEVRAGPTADGGYLVEAVLPIAERVHP